jgi:hypothetical protein
MRGSASGSGTILAAEPEGRSHKRSLATAPPTTPHDVAETKNPWFASVIDGVS